MQNTYVYNVIFEWVQDGDCGLSVDIFESFYDAKRKAHEYIQDEMENNYSVREGHFKQELNDEHNDFFEWCAYEEGAYTKNHTLITVEKTPLIRNMDTDVNVQNEILI